MVHEAIVAREMLAEEGISATVIDMHTIKPFDNEAVIEAAKKTGAIVTAENHNILNGLGSAVAECLGENYPVPMNVSELKTTSEKLECKTFSRKVWVKS